MRRLRLRLASLTLPSRKSAIRVGGGVYQRLVDRGLLGIADGLMVQPPSQLWDMVLERWGVPFGVVCDFFRLGELHDAIQGACEIEPRRARWSEASADIRALRRIGRDGPLSIPKESELLFAESLSGGIRAKR